MRLLWAFTLSLLVGGQWLLLSSLAKKQLLPWQPWVFVFSLVAVWVLFGSRAPRGRPDRISDDASSRPQGLWTPPPPTFTPVPGRSPRATWLTWLWEPLAPRLEVKLAVAVLGLAVFLRFFLWDRVPPAPWTDELLAISNGLRLLDAWYQGHPLPLFGTLPLISYRPHWVHTFNLYSYFVAGVLWLGGTNLFGLKLVSILPGCATVFGFYWLLRELRGPRLALLGSLLLATSRWHLVQSRYEWDGTFAVAGAIIGLAAMARALRTGQWRYMALGGMAFGLIQYSYLASRASAAAALGWLLVLVVGGMRGKGWAFRRSALVALGVWLLSFGVAAGPVVIHTLKNPTVAKSRFEELRLDKASPERQQPTLVESTQIYLKAFGHTGKRHARQALPEKPLLPKPLYYLGLVGAGICLVGWRRREGHSLSWTVFLVSLAPGILSLSGGTPNLHRVGLTCPLVYLWIAQGLESAAVWLEALLQRWRERAPTSRALKARWLVGAMVAGVVGVTGVKEAVDYFAVFGLSGRLWSALPNNVESHLANAIRDRLDGYDAYTDLAFTGESLEALLWRPPHSACGRPRGGISDPTLQAYPIANRRFLPLPGEEGCGPRMPNLPASGPAPRPGSMPGLAPVQALPQAGAEGDRLEAPSAKVPKPLPIEELPRLEPGAPRELLVATLPAMGEELARLYPGSRWFVGFTPFEKPMYAVGVMSEAVIAQARARLQARAALVRGELFLLPEDLKGPGVLQVLNRSERPEGLEALDVVRGERFQDLPQGRSWWDAFAMEWHAWLWVPEEGDYAFDELKGLRTTRLTIDGERVTLSKPPVPIHLTAGYHAFLIKSTAGRYRKISLKWRRGEDEWEWLSFQSLVPRVPPELSETLSAMQPAEPPAKASKGSGPRANSTGDSPALLPEE